jgi:hypothetical protein
LRENSQARSPGGIVRRRPRPGIYPHRADRRRPIAAFAVLGVTVLLGFSYGSPWWQTTLYLVYAPYHVGAPPQVVVNFGLGGAVSCSASRWSYTQQTANGSFSSDDGNPCTNVSPRMSGPQAVVYRGVGIGIVGLVGMSVVASALALLGLVGFRVSRQQLRLLSALVLAASVVGSGIVVGTTLTGPGPAARVVCQGLSLNSTGCPGFGGSVLEINGTVNCSQCLGDVYWGAGPAFFETTTACVLGWLAWFLLWSRRNDPYTREEEEQWARANEPYSLTGSSGEQTQVLPSSETLPTN